MDYQITNFKPIYNKESKVLILGSHPSVKSKEVGFYYGNPRNRFWLVLGEILKEDFTHASIAEKELLLLKHNIALSDVVYACYIEGSSDASINNVTPNEAINTIINSCNITNVILNGKTAYNFFIKYFKEYEKMAICLPSTSPANAAKSTNDLIHEWSILNELV